MVSARPDPRPLALAEAAGTRRRFGRRAAIVVAHPDDETLGASLQFGRWARLTVVHVTDGAPRSLHDARAAGFTTAAAYAQARRGELAAAMGIAGHDPAGLIALRLADQQAAFAVRRTALRLESLLKGVDVVFTHAFEGGHPDHDAVAIAVHAAVERMAGRDGRSPVVVGMPLYRDDGSGRFLRSLVDRRRGIWAVVRLDGAARDRKGRMIATFRSQSRTLGRFDLGGEEYGIVDPPPLDRLPNGGRIFYERFGWGLQARHLLGLARRARLSLGLDPITGRCVRPRGRLGHARGRPWR